MKKLSLAAALVAMVAVGCSKGGDNKDHGKTGGDHGKTGGTTTAPTPDAGPKQTLTATVKFTGTAPAAAPLKREADPFCGKTKMTSEEVLVKDGKLQNVFVRVVDVNAPAPAGEHTVDQNNCMYRPRVSGVVAGQTIAIKNSDQTGHNVHTYKGDETIFNIAQPAPGIVKKTADQLNVTNGPITFKCDIHPWMTGYVIVNSNPYFGTTDETGMAKIELPAGKYKLEAWHEKYGVKTAEVEVKADAPATVEFTYDGTEKTGS